MDKHRFEHRFRLQPIVLGLHLAFVGAVMAAPGPNELPTGGQVTYGSATISQPGAAQLQINQATQQATLNWNTFNIGAQAQVEFKQPNASAVALNRVVQDNASVIEGRLTANGQVFLVNPSGVLFGKNAQVDVGGLVATTMKISDADFQRGNYQFARDGATGEVVNQGQIRAANGGYVALVGATVRNEGTIQANHGTVALAAGDGARLEFGDGKLVNVQVDAATIKTLVENKQLIQAEGGRVLMTAVAASKLQGAVINNAGAIEANSLTSVGGVVRLEGADEIHNSGTVDASGKTAGGNVTLAANSPLPSGGGAGGEGASAIHQSGVIKASATAGGAGNISLSASGGIDNSGRLDASGTTAGGNVTVALSGELPQTDSVSKTESVSRLVRQSGTIHADATVGVGGKVVLTGDYLQLDNASLTTAKGATGGGQIYAGGGLHGSPLPLAGEGPGERAGNAKSTRVEAGATLDASATDSGDGGTIVAWGNDASRAYGTFNAKGGPNGGDGGLVETSGHWLAVDGAKVDTQAPQGNSGDWLLDPYDVTISTAVTGGGTSSPSPITGGGTWTPNATGSNVNNTDIASGLANGNVTITTTGAGTENGDINVNAPVTWSSNNTFSLQASRNINVNASLTATGTTPGLTLSYGAAAGNGDFVYAPINLPTTATLNIGPGGSAGTAGSLTIYKIINTATALQAINTNSTSLSDNYALGSSLDLSSVSNFSPLGSDAVAFSGKFDGLGHTLSGLTINQPSTFAVGLFGFSSGSIRNIGVLNSVMTGLHYVGGLVGHNTGSINNAYSTGTTRDSNAGMVGGLVGWNDSTGVITQAHSSGAVISGPIGSYDGGLVGANDGTITNAYSSATVTSSFSSIDYNGGLVGVNNGSISNAYSTGAVTLGSGGIIGGLVGVNVSSISNAYSTGAVTSGSGINGGLVGYGGGGTVSASFWDIQTSGQTSSGGGTGMTTADMMNLTNFTTATPANGNVNPNWNFTTAWWMSDGNTRPFLRSEYSTTLTNAHQLQLMAVNPAASYTLANNIDMSELQSASGMWNTATGFVPVGIGINNFTGSFDGGGHTISSLTINQPSIATVGLFGFSSGTISNVGLVGGSVSGNGNIGGLVGYNSYGNITNAYSTGAVTSNGFFNIIVIGGLVGYNYYGHITNAYSAGVVTNNGSISEIGGLVGENYVGNISNSYSTGAVTANGFSNHVGGLVGYNYGNITNAFSTGKVTANGGNNTVGGLVSYNTLYGSVTNAYSTGAVTASGGNNYVGGLVGYNYYGNITNAYSTGLVTASGSGNTIGGLVGNNNGGTVSASFWDVQTSGQTSSGGGTGLTTTQMMTKANFTSATPANGNVNPNWNFTTDWWMSDGDTRPFLRSEYSTTITNAHQLQLMAINPAANYTLANNIDMNELKSAAGLWNISKGFVPMGNFSGSFNGSGYVINGLTINLPTFDNVGLFGYSSGSISNVGLVGGSVSGQNYVGGLVGNNYGTISNAYNTGAVSGSTNVGGLIGYTEGNISNAYSTGPVSGVYEVGGLVGYNKLAALSNAYSTGTVSGSSDFGGLVGKNTGTITFSHSSGEVKGNGSWWVGGLVGTNAGSISNAYSTGAVSGLQNVGGLVGLNTGNISNAYSTGAVSGNQQVGGLVGLNNAGTFTKSFWDTQTSGIAAGTCTTPGTCGTGLTTADMMKKSSFSGWNFITDWWISPDNGYTRPFLRSEYSATITNAHQLQLMLVNPAASYTLANNIVMSELNSAAGLWNINTGFVPVGDSTNNFTGSFDGGGHTISGLTINQPGTDYVGLFGYSAGSIRNVGLVGSSIRGNIVGGLAGSNTGSITNAYSTGTFSDEMGGTLGGLVGWNQATGTITLAYSAGAVNSGGGNLGSYNGGLVGWNEGSITKAYSTASVSSPDNNNTDHNGGLVGSNEGSISNAYSTGAVTYGGGWNGGLVGSNGYQGTISNAYSTGAVILGSDGANGGLVGVNVNIVTHSFWGQDTSGQTNSAAGTGLTTAQMMTKINFSTAGWDFTNIWGIIDGVSYPYLQFQFLGAPPQIVSGTLNGTDKGGKTIQTAQNGSVLTTVSTGVNGFYYLALPAKTIPSGNVLLSYLTNPGDNPAATVRLSDGNSLTGVDLFPNTLTVGSNNSTAAVSNADIAAAKGSLTDTAIPYTATGNNITVNSGVAFTTASNTNFNLNGNISTQNADITLNSNTHLVMTNLLTASGTGNVTLNITGGANEDDGSGITAAGLQLLGAGNYGLFKANYFNTLAINTSASWIGLGVGNDLTIGKVGNTTGINTHDQNLELELGGNLSIQQSLDTGVGRALLGVYGSGGISQTDTGLITTDSLLGNVTGTVLLDQANTISNLGGWYGFNAGGDFTLNTVTPGGLTVTGTVKSTKGLVSITNTGGNLTVDATGSVTGFSSVNLTTANSGDIVVQGTSAKVDGGTKAVNLSAAGSIRQTGGQIVTNGGTVTLTATSGGISQTGGNITTDTLTGSAATTASLASFTNAITKLGTFSAQGDFTLNNANALSITGAVNTNGSVASISSGGTLTLAAGASVTGSSVSLTATGSNSDVVINNAITWADNGALTLQAGRNIQINADIAASGDSPSLTLAYGSADGNDYFLNNGAVINLPGSSTTLHIGPTGSLASYTVLNSLGIESDTSGATLQGMQGNLSHNYALGSNINASATARWNFDNGDYAGFNPVGDRYGNAFTGNFHGLGHSISGLTINRPATDGVGLFGYTQDGTLRNIGLTGGAVTGLYYVGTLVGSVDHVTIANAYNTGAVSGNTAVGGLVGVSTTTTITNAYNTGAVSGNNYVGGLVGVSTTTTITNAYNTGAVSGNNTVGGLVGNNDNGSTIANAYSTGAVSGNGNVGGLVGSNLGQTITNSFWDKNTSGQDYSQGGTGLSTAEMMTQGSFTNWDFTKTWGIIPNVSYPYLQFQFGSGQAPQIVTGILSGADVGGKTVQTAQNGSLLATASTGANGYYYFALSNNSIPSGNSLLAYLSNPGSNPAATVRLSDGNSLSNVNLSVNLLTVGSNSPAAVSNADIAAAKGSLTDAAIPYTVDGNNLTVNYGVAFTTASNTNFNLNGDITTQDTDLTLPFTGPTALGYNLNAGAGTLTLDAIGALTHTAGTLTAATVNIGSGGTTTAIGASGSPVVTATANLNAQSSNGDIWLDNTGAVDLSASTTGGGVNVFNTGGTLTVPSTGAVAGNGVSLQTLTSGDIVLNGAVNGHNGNVSLISAGGISQSSTGLINTRGSLSGSAGGTVTLGENNNIATLANFSANSLTLYDIFGDDLTITGTVSSPGAIAIISDGTDLTVSSTGSVSGNGVSLTTVTGGNISLDGDVNGNAGGVTLNSVGNISQTGGKITTTGILTGSAATTASLTSTTNAFAKLGTFTTHGDFSLADSLALTLTGAVNAGTHTATLNAIAGAVQSAAGIITADTLVLQGPTADYALGTATNLVNHLSAPNVGSVNFTNGQTLLVDRTGGITAHNADGVTLTTTGAGSNLKVTQDLITTDANAPITLSSADQLMVGNGSTAKLQTIQGNITLTGDGFSFDPTAVIQSTGGGNAGYLWLKPHTDSKTIGIGLSSGKDINLASSLFNGGVFKNGFNYVQIGSDTNTGGITVNADTTVGDDLRLVQGSGPIAINAGLTVEQNLLLQTTGSGTEGASGAITAYGLQLLGTGGNYVLGSANNQISRLAGNTGSVDFTNNQGYAVGTVTNGATNPTSTTGMITTAGDIALHKGATSAVGNIAINAPLDANNGNIVLEVSDASGGSGSGSTQTAGMTAHGLLLLGTGSHTLTNANNAISVLAGAGSAGGITGTGTVQFTDSQALSIGLVTHTKGLNSGGDVTLKITGGLTQSQSLEVDGTLSGSATSLNLNIPSNTIAKLGTTTTQGMFTLNDSVNLNITGAVNSNGGAVSLYGNGVSGSGTVSAGNNTLLVDAGGGTFNLAGAISSTSTLGTAITLQNANAVTLRNIFATTTGDNTGTPNGGLVLGTSTKPITDTVTQTDSTGIYALTLTGYTTRSVVLGQNNTITSLGSFTSGGDFNLQDISALNLTGTLDTGSGTGASAYLSTGGLLNLGANGNIKANGVSLSGSGVSSSSTSTVNAGSGDILVDGKVSQINLAGTLTTTSARASAVTVQDGRSATLGNIIATSGGVVIGQDRTSDFVGGVSQTAGTAILANTLAGGAFPGRIGGSVSLNQTGNAIATLRSFLISGTFTLYDGASLSVTGPVSGSGVDLETNGSNNGITLSGSVTARNSGTVKLIAGNGDIAQSAGSITAGVLTGSATAGTGTTTGQATFNSTTNAIAQLGPFTTAGNFSLTDANASGLSLAGNVVSHASDGNGTVAIVNSTGALALGGYTVASGSASSTGTTGVTLNGIGVSSASGSIVDGGTGPVSVNGGGSGEINLAGTLKTTSSSAQAVWVYNGSQAKLGTLTASNGGVLIGWANVSDFQSGVTQNADTIITTDALTGNTHGLVNLGNANAIAKLGAFSTVGAFTLSNTGPLNITGTVNTGSGAGASVAISTSGALSLGTSILDGNGVTLNGVGVSSTGGTVNSGSGNILIDAGGGTLSLASELTTTSADATAVTVQHGSSAALGNITALNGTVVIGNGSTDFGGGVTQNTDATIHASALTGSTGGSVTLANTSIATLANFSAHSLTLYDISGDDLTITGTVNSPGAIAITSAGSDLTVSNTGAVSGNGVSLATVTSGNISLVGDVNGNAGGVTLNSVGDISQTGGTLSTTGTLTGSAATTAALNQTNAIARLGAFNTHGDFSLTNGQALTITGIVDSGNTGNVTLNLTGGATEAGGSGIIGAGLGVIGDGTGNVSLYADNQVHTLAVSGTGIGFTNNAGLTIGTVGAITGINTHNQSAEIDVKGDISIAQSLNTGTSGVTLGSSGGISQTTPGLITADTLFGNVDGTVSLSLANRIANLGGSYGFTAGGDFSLNNTTGLTVNGAVKSTAGLVSITNTGGDLTVAGTGSVTGDGISLTSQTGSINLSGLVAGGGTAGTGNVVLNAANGGSESTGGSITGFGLELLGKGATYTLTNDTNQVAVLAGGSAANPLAAVSFTDGRNLSIGTVNSTIGLTATESVSLTDAGNTVSQTQAITADGLELLGNNATYTLNESTNQVATLAGGSAANPLAAVSFTDGRNLSIDTVNSTVGLTVVGNLSLTDAGNTVSQTQAITAAGLELLGKNATYTLLASTNQVGTLAGGSATNPLGSVQFLNAQTLTMGTVNNTSGITAIGGVSLKTSAGNINGDGNGFASAKITTNDQTTGVVLDAAGGIGMGTAGTPAPVYTRTHSGCVPCGQPATPLTLTTNGTGIQGNIDLLEQNTLETSRVDISAGLSVGTGRSVSLASLASPNTIFVNADIGHVGDDLALADPNGNIFAGGGRAIARILTLNAGLALGASGNPLTTSATTLNATASGGDIWLRNDGGRVFTGAPNGLGDLTLSANATGGSVNVNNTSSVAGNVSQLIVSAGGNITPAGVGVVSSTSAVHLSNDQAGIILNGSVESAGAGDAVTLAANTVFTNHVGANAVTIRGTGRWLIYSADPNAVGESFGLAGNVLRSNQLALWNQAYADTPVSPLPDNRYLFNIQPALVFAGNSNVSKVYGSTLTAAQLWTAPVGYYGGQGDPVPVNGLGTAYVQDTYAVNGTASITGTPAVSPNGSAANDPVVNKAPIILTVGSLISTNGILARYLDGDLTITPLPVKLYAQRIYDGTTSVSGSLFTVTNLVPNDTLAVGGSATTSSKNVGTYASPDGLNLGNLSLGVDDSASSSLTSKLRGGGAQNYTLTGATGTVKITQAWLNLAAVKDIKTYDGTPNSLLAINTTGLATNDTVSFPGSQQSFDSKNVGSRTLSVNPGYTVNDGNGGNNYTITLATAPGQINPAPLAITSTDVIKTYDGNLSALGSPVVASGTLYSGDFLRGGSFSFTDRNFGVGNKVVTVNGVTVSDGSNFGNYTVTYTNNTTSTINKALLNLSAQADAKVYDGNINSTGVISFTGLVAGDSLSQLSQSFDRKNAGTRTLSVNPGYTVNDGNGGNNYTITLATAPGQINPAPLAITSTDVSKTYDGNLSALGSPVVASGILYSGDFLSGGMFSFTDRNFGIGNKVVTVNGVTVGDGSNVGNYTVTYADNTTSTINKALLNLSAQADAKVYDGNTRSSRTPTYAGLIAGDSMSSLSQRFDSPEVGTRRLLVDTYALNDGNSGNNYFVTFDAAPGSIVAAQDNRESTANTAGAIEPKYGPRYNYNTSGGTAFNDDRRWVIGEASPIIIVGDEVSIGDVGSGDHGNHQHNAPAGSCVLLGNRISC